MKRARGDGVVSLKTLFEAYKERFKAPQKSVVDAAREVIHDLLGITLTEKQLTYTPSSRTLVIRASGILKTEILFKKEEILTHLKGRLGERSAPEQML